MALGQGSSGTSYVYVNPQYGFAGNVNLSVSGLPSGVTASFSLNPTTSNSVLTLTASSAAAPGQYALTITGTSGTQTVTTPFALGIYAPSFILSPGSIAVGQGGVGTANVGVYPQYGFSGKREPVCVMWDGAVSDKAQITTWLPYDLMDQMTPAPRNSPDDWIGSLDDGAAAIIAGVGHGGTAQKICLLRDGEVVKFCSMTTHGSAILTL